MPAEVAEVIDVRERDDVVLDGRQVLLVDDDDLCRAQIKFLLAQKNLKVVEAADAGKLQEILDDHMPACILLDYDLVSESGLFVLERLRQRYASLAPIVMISADETQRTAVRAFRAGVADFINKRGLRLDDLAAAVRRAIAQRANEEVRDRELDRLRKNACYDEHTGLLLRKVLEERLEAIAEASRRGGRPWGIAALHLARVGEIQDRFGVVAADRMIRAFGKKLRGLVRSSDLCGVWDRGTFVLVVDFDVSGDSFAAVVDRVREQATLEIDLAAAHLRLTAMTVNAVYPDDGDTVERVLACLESKLEQAKQAFTATAAVSADWVTLAAASGDDEPDQHERRRETRRRTLKQGRIVLAGLHSTIDCTIRNMSPHGAGLRLMGPMAIPELFRLQITDSGVIQKVRKRWHHNNDIGVEFLPD